MIPRPGLLMFALYCDIPLVWHFEDFWYHDVQYSCDIMETLYVTIQNSNVCNRTSFKICLMGLSFIQSQKKVKVKFKAFRPKINYFKFFETKKFIFKNWCAFMLARVIKLHDLFSESFRCFQSHPKWFSFTKKNKKSVLCLFTYPFQIL